MFEAISEHCWFCKRGVASLILGQPLPILRPCFRQKIEERAILCPCLRQKQNIVGFVCGGQWVWSSVCHCQYYVHVLAKKTEKHSILHPCSRQKENIVGIEHGMHFGHRLSTYLHKTSFLCTTKNSKYRIMTYWCTKTMVSCTVVLIP